MKCCITNTRINVIRYVDTASRERLYPWYYKVNLAKSRWILPTLNFVLKALSSLHSTESSHMLHLFIILFATLKIACIWGRNFIPPAELMDCIMALSSAESSGAWVPKAPCKKINVQKKGNLLRRGEGSKAWCIHSIVFIRHWFLMINISWIIVKCSF